ncbi:hypothetical protein B296_00009499 [Ensete ventricosum]|uniref:Peptidase A2 domain-containing protein n=1 Tax=Ensete ventricosum TaxID=4639 RepID=A0A427AGK0_ENSVE|nr:hypothetical protein B296_00009499 [Ensete ventricosum]
MANSYVERVMIDTGSSTDILYFDAFQKLGWTDKDLVTLTSTLTGFTGDFVSPVGATTIPVTFGGEPRSKTLMVSFMVVKLPLVYNAIIGHPTLNRLKAVVSTYHRLLKFLTRTGVGEVRSDPRENKQCYLRTITLSKKSKVQSATANSQANALARLTSSCATDTSPGGIVRTTGSSVTLGVLSVNEEEGRWIIEIIHFKQTGALPEDKVAARQIKRTESCLAFGTKAVLPPDLVFPTLRIQTHDEEASNQQLCENLDLLEKKQADVDLRTLAYRRAVAKLYNHRVRPQLVKMGDLVLRKAEVSDPTRSHGKLALNWEGPYREGTYTLATIERRVLPRTWHISNLRNFFA